MNTHLLLRAVFLVLMINLTQSQGNDDLYSICSNLFNCGQIQGIGYPFWGGKRSSNCGYPAPQLACEDNTATITISNVKYLVLDFDPDIKVLQIAREDLLDRFCSPDFTNTILDPALFSVLNGYSNFTFIYGCPSMTTTPLNIWMSFSCAISGMVYTRGYVVSGAVGPGSCSKSVVVPVYLNPLSESGSSSVSFTERMQRGFKVRLVVDSAACKRCSTSKGVCGYDISRYTMACYCADGSTGLEKCLPPAPGPHVVGPSAAIPSAVEPSAAIPSAVEPSAAYPSVVGPSAPRPSVVGPSAPRPSAAGPFAAEGFNRWSEFFTVGALVIGVSISATGVIFILKITNGIFPWKLIHFKKEKGRDVDKLIGIHGPRRYRYIDVKKMTNSFSEKLGQGGFGAVYKGKIRDGCLVAVKILKESKSSPEEFINEVVSISRTSHVNVITLLGFCYEGHRRALIFEYMPNGSLDKFIASGKAGSLEWRILYQIAVGIARGLEYLHRGCNTRILHFDIKPQNILLDGDFIPKISDFGLAKLCHGQESAVSIPGMRGTVGFIAPEVVWRNLGRVSHKSDVYSYGMLVLEMVGVRNSDNKASKSSEMCFPDWIYRNLEPSGDLKKLPTNVTEEEKVLARKMIIVSLWCIQTSPSDRPPIVKVLEMLEGSIELLQMPPKPMLYSPTRPSSQRGEVTISNSNGGHEEVRVVQDLEESTSNWQSCNLQCMPELLK